MNRRFSNAEMADIHYLHGSCNGNAAATRRRYIELHLIEEHLLEGLFSAYTKDCEKVDRFAEEIEMVEGPERTREISRAENVSQATVWRILHEQNLHPFHRVKVQELLSEDLEKRRIFCRWILENHQQDPSFSSRILFTDESCFHRKGVLNMRNMHVWADANPHAVFVNHTQQNFRINYWMGFLGNHLLGPWRLPDILTGQEYLSFLENHLPELLEDLPLADRVGMWFMQVGAPPHFAVDVRQWLQQHFAGRWIGRGNEAPHFWPPRSPDLNPLDFYVWGTIKQEVYKTQVENLEDLMARVNRITTERKNSPATLERVHRNFLKSVRACLEANGGHFQQYLD
ncbi:hypothetical protein TcasGA2_TC012948 [Tribolium castaneum]|uniref:Tc1-like transposase DDE domain-containing protein n=1 Tax=Tribolium castaneum TaxID=7070 RepID=D6X3E4_TRICA|nr:hypothetical protein TcasGA2_TC012948 [Tribolium castaneum]